MVLLQVLLLTADGNNPAGRQAGRQAGHAGVCDKD